MVRVFQNVGIIDILNGKTIQHLLCVSWCDLASSVPIPQIFWIKTYEEQHWNRFFLDAGIAFWETQPQLNKEDFEESTDLLTDLGQDSDLIGTTVCSIVAYQEANIVGELPVSLCIQFSSGHTLLFQHTESASILEIQKEKR